MLKQRKNGASLRGIALATGLGVGTVRTILAVKKRTQDDRRRIFDRLRAARHRQQKRARDTLPAQIVEVLKKGEALIKEAKGPGR